MSSPAPPTSPLTPPRALRYYNIFRVARRGGAADHDAVGHAGAVWRQWLLSGWLLMYGGLVVLGVLLPRLRIPLEWGVTVGLAGDIALLVVYMHEYAACKAALACCCCRFWRWPACW